MDKQVEGTCVDKQVEGTCVDKQVECACGQASRGYTCNIRITHIVNYVWVVALSWLGR